MDDRRAEWWHAVTAHVEPRRREIGLSIRRAARAAGMSEALWRQLVTAHHSNPGVGHRYPTRAQALDMAAAVGVQAVVARVIKASPDEIAASAARRPVLPDEGEQEIRRARHLTGGEKAALIETLRAIRAEERETVT